jgi:hypothetical protein
MTIITTDKWDEVINIALSNIPKELHKYIQTDWIIGPSSGPKEIDKYERDISRTPGASFNYLLEDKRNCIYLPIDLEDNAYLTPEVVIHEIGHIIHNELDWVDTRKIINPVCDYAAQNNWELFACAFTQWTMPINQWTTSKSNPEIRIDSNTRQFFENLRYT